MISDSIFKIPFKIIGEYQQGFLSLTTGSSQEPNNTEMPFSIISPFVIIRGISNLQLHAKTEIIMTLTYLTP